MTTRDALLRAVLDHPDDDTARLVYADALDETGRPWDAAQAELIRLQIGRRARTGHEVVTSLQREERILGRWGAKWLPAWARFDRAALGWHVRGDSIEFPYLSCFSRYVFERGFVTSVMFEQHDSPFDGKVLGNYLRALLAHRPTALVGLRLSGHAPSVTFEFLRYGDGWRAERRTDDDDSPSWLFAADRRSLVAGIGKWVAHEMANIEFEQVANYDDEMDELYEIPF